MRGWAGMTASSLYEKSRTVKMRRGECATDFEFLANNHRSQIAGDAQLYYPAGTAEFHRLQLVNLSEIDSLLPAQQILQFLLHNSDSPAIEIDRLLIEVGKNFAVHISIFGVAVCRRIFVNPHPGIRLVR